MFFYCKRILKENKVIFLLEKNEIILFTKHEIITYTKEFRFINKVEPNYVIKDVLFYKEKVYLLTDINILIFENMNFTLPIECIPFTGTKLILFNYQPIVVNKNNLFFIFDKKSFELEEWKDLKFYENFVYLLNEKKILIYEYNLVLVKIKEIKIEKEKILFLFTKNEKIFLVYEEGVFDKEECIFNFENECPIKQMNNYLITSKRVYEFKSDFCILEEIECEFIFTTTDFLFFSGKNNFIKLVNQNLTKDIKNNLSLCSYNENKLELKNEEFSDNCIIEFNELDQKFYEEVDLNLINNTFKKFINDTLFIQQENIFYIYNLKTKKLVKNEMDEKIKDVLLLEEEIYIINEEDALLESDFYFSFNNLIYYLKNNKLIGVDLEDNLFTKEIYKGKYLNYKNILFIYNGNLIRMYDLNIHKTVFLQCSSYTIETVYLIGDYLYVFSFGNVIEIYKILKNQLSLPFIKHIEENILYFKEGIFYLQNELLLFQGFKSKKIPYSENVIFNGNFLITFEEKIKFSLINFDELNQEIPEKITTLKNDLIIENKKIKINNLEREFEKEISFAFNYENNVIIIFKNEIFLFKLGIKNLIKKDELILQSEVIQYKINKVIYLLTRNNSIKLIEIKNDSILLVKEDIQRRNILEFKIYNDFLLCKTKDGLLILEDFKEVCFVKVKNLTNFYFNQYFYYKSDNEIYCLKPLTEKIFFYFYKNNNQSFMINNLNLIYDNCINKSIDYKLLNEFNKTEINEILEIIYEKNN